MGDENFYRFDHKFEGEELQSKSRGFDREWVVLDSCIKGYKIVKKRFILKSYGKAWEEGFDFCFGGLKHWAENYTKT